jgi:NAD(P)H-nitrite reductase large subunit
LAKYKPPKTFQRKGEIFLYNHLVLAIGSRPLIPLTPGVDAETVTPFRSLKDLSLLRRYAAKGKQAVIVGRGYIELAAKPSDNTHVFAAKNAAGKRLESKSVK